MQTRVRPVCQGSKDPSTFYKSRKQERIARALLFAKSQVKSMKPVTEKSEPRPQKIARPVSEAKRQRVDARLARSVKIATSIGKFRVIRDSDAAKSRWEQVSRAEFNVKELAARRPGFVPRERLVALHGLRLVVNSSLAQARAIVMQTGVLPGFVRPGWRMPVALRRVWEKRDGVWIDVRADYLRRNEREAIQRELDSKEYQYSQARRGYETQLAAHRSRYGRTVHANTLQRLWRDAHKVNARGWPLPPYPEEEN